ncbi:MAG: DUF1858 domain-containing protein [Clostridia bacterium]
MITKDMTIMEAVQANENAADVLLSIGMHCLGCAMAHGETVAEAAEAHGVDIDKLIEMLNA